MIIKDRLIEVDVTEALAIAGKGEKVRCVGEGTGLMTIADALDGLTFFAPESALVPPDTLKVELDPVEVEKFITDNALRPSTPVTVQFDTPENRTRAIIDSVERYDEEHGDPPTTRQEEPEQETPEQETPRAEPPKAAPKAEALAKEYSGGGARIRPFRVSPVGGGVEEMTSGKIKINGHNTKPTEATKAPLAKADEQRKLTIEWTDDMLGVLGAMRYTLTADGQRTTKWSLDRLRTYFKGTYDDVNYGLELYQMNEKKYDAAAEKYILPDVRAGRAAWTSIKKKEEENT